MRTINFGKNLRLSQIQPIKTAEFKFIQFGKKKGKTLHPVYGFRRTIINIFFVFRLKYGHLNNTTILRMNFRFIFDEQNLVW